MDEYISISSACVLVSQREQHDKQQDERAQIKNNNTVHNYKYKAFLLPLHVRVLVHKRTNT